MYSQMYPNLSKLGIRLDLMCPSVLVICGYLGGRTPSLSLSLSLASQLNSTLT